MDQERVYTELKDQNCTISGQKVLESLWLALTANATDLPTPYVELYSQEGDYLGRTLYSQEGGTYTQSTNPPHNTEVEH